MIAQTRFRVLYGDADPMGQAYYGNYLKWFEVGRGEWFRACGTSYREVEEKGIYLPIVEAHCSYKKPAFYDDTLTVSVRFKFVALIRLRFDYVITREEDVLTTGYTIHVCVNKERKVLKPPDFLKNLLELNQEQASMPGT